MRKLLIIFIMIVCVRGMYGQRISDTTEFWGKLNSNVTVYQQPKYDPQATVCKIETGKNVAVVSIIDIQQPTHISSWCEILKDKQIGYVQDYFVDLPVPKRDFLKSRAREGREARLISARRIDSVLTKMDSIDNVIAELKLRIAERKEFLIDSLTAVRRERTINNGIAKGFMIVDHNFYENSYTIDFEIKLANYSKKTIKYVWVTVSAYNPVKDHIATKTVQIIGPVEPETTAEVTFESVFYTRVFGYGKIFKVKIQYMDGSVKEFSGTILQSLIYQ